jgi:putative ABC transport system permease protein
MLLFSIKNAFRKKGIAVLSSAGIGFGLMLMFVLGAFSAGVSAQFTDNFSKAIGIVQITQFNRQGYLSRLPLNTTPILFDNTDFGSDILSYNVQSELPSDFTLNYQGQLQNMADRITVIGINQSIDQNWGGSTTNLESGRIFNPESLEVIIDSRLVALNPSYGINNNLTLYLAFLPDVKVNVTIVGIYTQEDLGAPSFVPRTYYAYLDIITAWNLLEQAGLQNQTFSQISLQFPATTLEETNNYIDRIKTFSDAGGFEPIKVEAFSTAQFLSSIESTLSILDAFVGVISFITILAGGMAIIVSQLMSVAERMKEFGILKATGWKNSHIVKNVIYESLSLGILGAVIGIGLGSGLITGLQSGAGPFSSAQAVVTPMLILRVLFFALGIGLVGGVYPGIKAGRVRPVKVLRGE